MAKPSYPRARRLAETVRRLVGEWIESEQVDWHSPGGARGPGPLVTVTDVRVTQDLHRATVFFTVLGDEQEQAAAAAWLAESTGRARTFVATQVRLRHAPTLEFVSDDVPGRGARIDRLLTELGTTQPGGPDQEGPQA
jgi:ribosome-binding factor A